MEQSAIQSKEIEMVHHWWVDRLVNDIESSEICVTAGYGSGKSFGSWQWLLDKMLSNPDCKTFAYAEPTYPLIESVAVPAFQKLMEFHRLVEGNDYKVRGGIKPKIEFLRTGQTIRLLSMSIPSAIVGFECGTAVIDEAALCKKEAYQRLKARMRASGIEGENQILFVSTPEGLNWLSDMFDSEAQSGWKFKDKFDSHKMVKIETIKGDIWMKRRRFRLTTYMNEIYLPPNYIAKEIIAPYGHNQNYLDSYVFGKFRPFSTGLVWASYKRAMNWHEEMSPQPDRPVELTWDFNICPAWVAIQTYRDDNRKETHYAIDNSNYGGEQLADACVEFSQKFPRDEFKNVPIHIYGDPSGHSKSHKVRGSDFEQIVKHLREIGYNKVVVIAPRPPAPLERVSVDITNRLFDEGILKVCENCDKVFESISKTVWKNEQRQKIDKPSGETHSHYMDSIKYYNWARQQRPVMI